MSNEDEAMTSAAANEATVERLSDCELVVRRRFKAPARLVFKAWTSSDLFMRWWVPKSLGMTLIACDLDVRTGGGYRLEFGHPSFDQPMVFFGRYIDVVPDSRIVWTNEESDDGAVTTVTFEETEGVTLLTVMETYPSKEALESSLGALEGMPEQLQQLEDLLSEMPPA